MIKVNYRDGRTQTFDLKRIQDSTALRRILEGSGCSDVTALSILSRKVLHTFPRPEVDILMMGANLLVNTKRDKVSGEVVWYDLGDVIVRYTVYSLGSKVTKLEVLKKRETDNARTR